MAGKLRVGRRYLWGAPAFGSARANFLDLLKRQHAIPGEADKYGALDQFLDRIADRLTDKSAALLQNVSVFAAIFGLMLFPGEPAPDITAFASMVLFLLASVFLARNLAVVWPKLSLGTVAEPAGSEQMREEWRSAMALIICRRAVRHTLALWLLVPAILLGAWSLTADARTTIVHKASEMCAEIDFCKKFQLRGGTAPVPQEAGSPD